METPKKGGAREVWTDAEKLGILFQLVARPIQWDQIELPPGRTMKAVQVMIDKERSKLKKANGEGGTPHTRTLATGKGKGTSGKSTDGKAKSTGKKRTADAVSKEDSDNDGASTETESPTASRKKSKVTSAKKSAKGDKTKKEDHESREDSPMVKEEVAMEEDDDED